MRNLITATVAISLANSGCAATIDVAYWIGDDHYTESTNESQPLPQTIDSVDYETAVEPDGSTRVACFARTRQVKRTWQVIKTYRYRGGFEKEVYGAITLFDVVFGGATAGTALLLCNDDKRDLSCWNALYATPFALDIGYALIRYAMVRPPLLIDKSSSEGSLAFVDEPVQEQATACESLASVWLGTVTGPDDLQILAGQAEGAGTRSLADGAVEIALDPTRAIALTPEVAERWALNVSLELYAVDRDGIPHRLAADRCALLGPVSASLSADAQAAYQKECVPSSTATEPPSSTATEPPSSTATEPPSSTATEPSDGQH
jgi:hypothetical protein